MNELDKETTEDIIRLMQEIWLFTDRPEYCRPESVRRAMERLEVLVGKYPMYAPEEE